MSFPERELARMVAAIPPGLETKEAPDLEVQIKAIKDEILAGIGGSAEKMVLMQRQLDALDIKLAERHVGAYAGQTLEKFLKEGEYADQVGRLLRDKKGSCVLTIPNTLLERKTTLTETGQGFQTTGVLQLDRIPGITVEGRQDLMIRNALTARPTTLGYIDFVKVLSPLSPASPAPEASTKFENAVSFTSVSEKVRTIATTLPASRQILDDMGELLGFLQTGLTYYVDLAEETQILSGDGTGENLSGIIPQATAFNTALLSGTAGWNFIDIIGRGIQQITAAKEFVPTFVVVHPNSWWSARLEKDGFGRYLLGPPMQDVAPNLFGLQVISTTSIASGTFVLGTGRPEASELRDRMETVVEISTQHASFFIQNLLMLRAERRTAYCVKRPGSFLAGSLLTSPT